MPMSWTKTAFLAALDLMPKSHGLQETVSERFLHVGAGPVFRHRVWYVCDFGSDPAEVMRTKRTRDPPTTQPGPQ